MPLVLTSVIIFENWDYTLSTSSACKIPLHDRKATQKNALNQSSQSIVNMGSQTQTNLTQTRSLLCSLLLGHNCGGELLL